MAEQTTVYPPVHSDIFLRNKFVWLVKITGILAICNNFQVISNKVKLIHNYISGHRDSIWSEVNDNHNSSNLGHTKSLKSLS